MSIINGSPSYNPYAAINSTVSNSAGNPALDYQEARAKHLQAEGLRLGNDATQDTNVKAAAEKRR